MRGSAWPRDCEMQAGGRPFSKLGQAAARSTAFITPYQRRRYSAQQSAPAAAVDLVREPGDSVTQLECGNRPRRRSVGPGRIEAAGFDFNLEEELFVEGAEATRDRSNAARRTALLHRRSGNRRSRFARTRTDRSLDRLVAVARLHSARPSLGALVPAVDCPAHSRRFPRVDWPVRFGAQRGCDYGRDSISGRSLGYQPGAENEA